MISASVHLLSISIRSVEICLADLLRLAVGLIIKQILLLFFVISDTTLSEEILKDLKVKKLFQRWGFEDKSRLCLQNLI